MNRCISGKDIASKIKISLAKEVSQYKQEIIFSIIYVGQDPVIDNFIRYKKKFGADIGVNVVVHSFHADIEQATLLQNITDISVKSDAMIVQLPLPEHLDADSIINAVPVTKDVDVLSQEAQTLFVSGKGKMIPPVTGALVEVLHSINISLEDKKITVLGYGDLVGKPFSQWLNQEGLNHTVITKETRVSQRAIFLQEADIIVSGVGEPSLVKHEMIRDGVILLDAGTSEVGKKIHGDIDPNCYEKASYYTPVPGGIGPITIAVLYQNIIQTLKK